MTEDKYQFDSGDRLRDTVPGMRGPEVGRGNFSAGTSIVRGRKVVEVPTQAAIKMEIEKPRFFRGVG
jgi:hypothetical protein